MTAPILNPEVRHVHSRVTALIAAQILIALIVLAGVFGRMMSYGLRRDETLFVPPAALLDHAALYRDFFFNHPPYSAWIFRLVHQLLPGIGLLQAGRIAVYLGWLFLVFAGGGVIWKISRSNRMTCFGVIALLCSDILLEQTGMAATNNLLPLAFGMVGLGLFLWQLSERQMHSPILFLAGLLTAMAVATKLSALALVPPLAIGALLVPRDLRWRSRLRQVALPVWLGGVVGLLPIFWLLATEPGLFLAHLTGFHTGPHIAYWREHASAEPDLALSLRAKAELAYSIWQKGGALLLIFITLLGLWLYRREAEPDRRPEQTAGTDALIISLAALACCLAMSFVPTPGFPQYYAQPLICLPLISAVLIRQTAKQKRNELASAAGVAAALCLALALPRLAEGLDQLRHPDDWQVSRMKAAGEALAETMAMAGVSGPVLSIDPIYPLEGGLAVYPEFATGPFIYRVAAYLGPDLLKSYRTTSPAMLDALLQTTPPAAILIGYDADLEAPMLQFAQTHNYRRTPFPPADDRYGKAVLYLRP